MSNILCVAVHPDDETLGCGGLLLRNKAEGGSIHWLLLTALPGDREETAPVAAAQQRCIDDVGAMYGFDSVHQCRFPSAALDRLPASDLVQAMGAVVREVRPDTIVLPFMHDVHGDHRCAFEAGYSCTKQFRYPSVRRVLMMETPSETDFAPAVPERRFSPNFFVDISVHFARKMEILARYGQELGEHPFPRSLRGVEALATVRGAACGRQYAEGFMLLKEIC